MKFFFISDYNECWKFTLTFLTTTEAPCDPQSDGTAECKAPWDTSNTQRRPTERGGNSRVFYSVRTHLFQRLGLYFFFRVSIGGAAATALHDQVRLRGSGRLSEPAASAPEHQRVETQSENGLTFRQTEYRIVKVSDEHTQT